MKLFYKIYTLDNINTSDVKEYMDLKFLNQVCAIIECPPDNNKVKVFIVYIDNSYRYLDPFPNVTNDTVTSIIYNKNTIWNIILTDEDDWVDSIENE
jgi:hypothetical protein